MSQKPEREEANRILGPGGRERAVATVAGGDGQAKTEGEQVHAEWRGADQHGVLLGPRSL
jgi:hypothetical protein